MLSCQTRIVDNEVRTDNREVISKQKFASWALRGADARRNGRWMRADTRYCTFTRPSGALVVVDVIAHVEHMMFAATRDHMRANIHSFCISRDRLYLFAIAHAMLRPSVHDTSRRAQHCLIGSADGSSRVLSAMFQRRPAAVHWKPQHHNARTRASHRLATHHGSS